MQFIVPLLQFDSLLGDLFLHLIVASTDYFGECSARTDRNESQKLLNHDKLFRSQTNQLPGHLMITSESQKNHWDLFYRTEGKKRNCQLCSFSRNASYLWRCYFSLFLRAAHWIDSLISELISVELILLLLLTLQLTKTWVIHPALTTNRRQHDCMKVCVCARVFVCVSLRVCVCIRLV